MFITALRKLVGNKNNEEHKLSLFCVCACG